MSVDDSSSKELGTGLSLKEVCVSENAKSGALLRERQPRKGSQLPVKDTVN